MKTHLIKFISIIFFITGFFVFSSATVYASASASGSTVPFSSLSKEEQDIFLKAAERLVDDIFNRTQGPTITFNMPDGTSYVGTKEQIIEQIKEKANADFVAGIKNSQGTTLNYIMTEPDSSPASVFIESIVGKSVLKNGALTLALNDYESSIYDILKKSNGEKNPLEIGIEIANGKPHNVTTIQEGLSVSVFDYLNLDYTVFSSLYDVEFNSLTLSSDRSSSSSTYYRVKDITYTPYFITSDNKLYLFQALIHTFYNRYDANELELYLYNGSQHSTVFSSSYRYDRNGHFSFRFYEYSGALYFCFYNSNLYYGNTPNTFYRTQYTVGHPQLCYSPVLFDDYYSQLKVADNPQVTTEFNNYAAPDGFDISFVNAVDHSDVLSSIDVLSTDIKAAGYFYGSFGFNSVNFKSAGQMLIGTENAVIGGDKSIISDLDAWQKGAYLLAQQQGITYEEILQKGLNLAIDNNGSMSLEDSEGVIYSLSELVSQFDKLIGATGDISDELSNALEYLKSLNLEELQIYIQSLEGTLNDLNDRDKDKSAVLGDCLGTLKDLQETLDSLNLENVSEDIHSIATSITNVQAIELDISESIDRLNPPSSITTKFPFSLPFDLYNIFNIFSADPVTPKFTIPFDFTAFGGEVYEINIDLSQFDYIANIIRWLLYGVFIIGLVLLTNKLIGRG